MSSQFRAFPDSAPADAADSADAAPRPCARPDDLALVQRVVRRESAALAAFVDRMECVPRFLRVRNARLGGLLRHEELEDVAQDVLVAIWRKLADYRGEAALETWVLQFCEFDLRNARRRAAIRRGVPIEEVREPGSGVVAGEGPVDLEAVYQAMRDLSPDEGTVVRMKHFEQSTFDQIAGQLGCSPNTAKTRYYRALEKLRAHLRRRQERDA